MLQAGSSPAPSHRLLRWFSPFKLLESRPLHSPHPPSSFLLRRLPAKGIFECLKNRNPNYYRPLCVPQTFLISVNLMTQSTLAGRGEKAHADHPCALLKHTLSMQQELRLNRTRFVYYNLKPECTATTPHVKFLWLTALKPACFISNSRASWLTCQMQNKTECQLQGCTWS
jgi:hypothetical protein